MRPALPIVLTALVLNAAACQKRHDPRRTVISHVVIFNMAQPDQAQLLIDACDRMIADIESVNSYACGRHLETGRSVVRSDYEVALIVGFDSPADYSAYLEDPKHTAFLDQWSAQISDIRIYDIHDPR